VLSADDKFGDKDGFNILEVGGRGRTMMWECVEVKGPCGFLFPAARVGRIPWGIGGTAATPSVSALDYTVTATTALGRHGYILKDA